MNIDVKSLNLAIVGGRVSYKNGYLYAINSFAKVIEELAKRYNHIYLSSSLKDEYDEEDDYRLPENLTLIPQPNWSSTLNSVKYTTEIFASYQSVIEKSNHIFVRGNPLPATRRLYDFCYKRNSPICHWLVGNPMAVLNSNTRTNKVVDNLGKIYVWLWEKQLIRGRRKANGTFICNGQELTNRYYSDRTYCTVSTSLSENDFYYRPDTCIKEEIKILCLCYIRPEKGIEYLVKALEILRNQYDGDRKIKLLIAGPRDRYLGYQRKLDEIVDNYKLKDCVTWLGHVPHNQINEVMRKADLFVLPSLSEGTPRVLLEAQANCLPVIATSVGGIPTSVSNNKTGILVPPKNAKMLSEAILEVLNNRDIRRLLIRNGYYSAKSRTVSGFVDHVVSYLNSASANDYAG